MDGIQSWCCGNKIGEIVWYMMVKCKLRNIKQGKQLTDDIKEWIYQNEIELHG